MSMSRRDRSMVIGSSERDTYYCVFVAPWPVATGIVPRILEDQTVHYGPTYHFTLEHIPHL
jgi:hypothetical protein